MYNAVIKFFALQHKLALPGIGQFSVETIPAQIDIANRGIISSKKKISFSRVYNAEEKSFFDFLSYELKVDEENAKLAFADFVSKLRNDLDNNTNVFFKGIGTLIKQPSNNILFEPEILPAYNSELPAERVLRNAAHSIMVGEEEKTSEEMHTALSVPKAAKKERWWAAAIVLAIIGIAAIAIYYITH